MEERRGARRYQAWFPMRLETTQGGGHLAVSRNISRTGLLTATAAKLEVGAPVTVKFRMEPVGPSEHVVHGAIVRFEDNKDDPNGLWPYWVAIEFAAPSPLLEEVVKDLETKGTVPKLSGGDEG